MLSKNFLYVLIIMIALLIYPTILISKKLAIELAFKKAATKFGIAIARNAEKIMRLESAHFTSKGFKITKGAGMQATTNNFPYGWNSHKKFWLSNLMLMPTKLHTMNENKQADIPNSGIVRKFIVFPSYYAGVAALCYFLQQHNNNAGRWFSTNIENQKQYNLKLSKIRAKYV